MTFLWPNLLWILCAVPVLALLYFLAQRRRRKYALRYASLSLVKEALGPAPGWRRHVPPALFLMALTVMIVGLARPQATVLLPSNHGTVILVIDVSGSMRAQDLKPNRLEAAKAAARAFVEKQPPNVKIGVVMFSSAAALVQPPTTVRDDIFAAMDRLMPQRGTSVGSGILVALNTIFEGTDMQIQDSSILSRRQPDPNQPLAPASPVPQPASVPPGSYTSAAIVLLSDGQSNTGPDPLAAADLASRRGVRVFTVGVGSDRGDIVHAEGFAFHVRLDEETLKRIAQMTAARYYKTDNEGDLLRIYKELSTMLVMGKEQTEVTAIFLAAAMIVLLSAGALSLVWFSRLP
jgi:Ca-activated chloride channel family protein